jgi:hypothetical protein
LIKKCKCKHCKYTWFILLYWGNYVKLSYSAPLYLWGICHFNCNKSNLAKVRNPQHIHFSTNRTQSGTNKCLITKGSLTKWIMQWLTLILIVLFI